MRLEEDVECNPMTVMIIAIVVTPCIVTQPAMLFCRRVNFSLPRQSFPLLMTRSAYLDASFRTRCSSAWVRAVAISERMIVRHKPGWPQLVDCSISILMDAILGNLIQLTRGIEEDRSEPYDVTGVTRCTQGIIFPPR